MYDELQARFGDQFFAQRDLARYTVARLGGQAAAVVHAKTVDDLMFLATWAHTHHIAWRVLGGGANVLIADAGFHGLIIINQARSVNINAATGLVEAESGANLSTVARRCMAKGLKGLEWSVSVPGTVGGAVVNNAGAHGGDMAGNLVDAQIFDLAAGQQTWVNQDFEYAYRHSKIKAADQPYVVLSARMQLEAGHPAAELNHMADEFIAHRKRTQPPGASLGSMFKNPPNDYAGRLIEAAGLKGKQMGGVQISPIHGNFFVNVGDGTAADYHALIELVQRTVQAQFDILLELEVERIGDW